MGTKRKTPTNVTVTQSRLNLKKKKKLFHCKLKIMYSPKICHGKPADDWTPGSPFITRYDEPFPHECQRT